MTLKQFSKQIITDLKQTNQTLSITNIKNYLDNDCFLSPDEIKIVLDYITQNYKIEEEN